MDTSLPFKVSPLQLLWLEGAAYYATVRSKLAHNQPVQRARVLAAHGLTALLLIVGVAGSVQLVHLVAEAQTATPPPTATAPRQLKPATPAAATPAAAPAPTALPRSVPTRLQIPSINVDAPVVSVGLDANGALEVPYHTSTGWYDGSPTPGETGPAIIDGHVDDISGIAVFWYLKDLHPGDKIIVSRADGSTVNFSVTSIESYQKDTFPTAKVYGDIDYPGLRLITCDGTFNYLTHHYPKNLVVFAKADL